MISMAIIAFIGFVGSGGLGWAFLRANRYSTRVKMVEMVTDPNMGEYDGRLVADSFGSDDDDDETSSYMYI
jgi:hypothetical protein